MGLFSKKKDPFENWPEMVIIPKPFFETLIRHMMALRFLSDLNQGMNGDIYMPATWLHAVEEEGAIDMGVKAVMDTLNKNAIDVHNDKFKLYATMEGDSITV